MRLAGIDIGTLTCRLLIADLLPDGRLKAVHAERRILRLGEDVDRSKRLSVAAMERVVHCLKGWHEAVGEHRIDGCAVVATSAVRDAANRSEFLALVTRETGLTVDVISGDEEARRTMRGIRSGLPAGVTGVLGLDIGGGSTEFILDRPGRQPVVKSIDIGVVRLSERILHHDPPTAEEIQRAREWVRQETERAMADMPSRAGLTFVGTAGTITALAAMAQRLSSYEPARIHNYRLTLEIIVDLERQLLGRTKAARVGLPGLEKNREDVIAAGAVIIRTVMDALGEKECLVSDLGLREGVLLTLADRLAAGRTPFTTQL
ncbi:Exopolyphosphatase [Nitrospira japonica]|uniref:Exopolyphosphatase n=1 Tax=Nitrospira japonica TaxID=1325564 RepID=A0A1W1I756_9BACT|nr:Exopolyphosphatase [Nitrospira japonica]